MELVSILISIIFLHMSNIYQLFDKIYLSFSLNINIFFDVAIFPEKDARIRYVISRRRVYLYSALINENCVGA